VEGKTLALAVAFTGLCVIGLGMLILFGGGPPPAPERPKPPSTGETTMQGIVRYAPTIYKAMLEQDAKKYEVPPLGLAQIARPNPYFMEFKGPKILTASIGQGQVLKTDHLVLYIQNLTPVYLAYRVETDVSNPKKCRVKGDIPHNAIVIEPGQTIRRTECIARRDESVRVKSVEVIEMPALSAYYVSRLPPPLVLYDTRTSAGHRPPKDNLCAQTFSWRDVREGAERGDLGWRDVIDFYARHNCDEYAFFRQYRYRTNPDEPPLPARPPDAP